MSHCAHECEKGKERERNCSEDEYSPPSGLLPDVSNVQQSKNFKLGSTKTSWIRKTNCVCMWAEVIVGAFRIWCVLSINNSWQVRCFLSCWTSPPVGQNRNTPISVGVCACGLHSNCTMPWCFLSVCHVLDLYVMVTMVTTKNKTVCFVFLSFFFRGGDSWLTLMPKQLL